MTYISSSILCVDRKTARVKSHVQVHRKFIAMFHTRFHYAAGRTSHADLMRCSHACDVVGCFVWNQNSYSYRSDIHRENSTFWDACEQLDHLLPCMRWCRWVTHILLLNRWWWGGAEWKGMEWVHHPQIQMWTIARTSIFWQCDCFGCLAHWWWWHNRQFDVTLTWSIARIAL